MLTTLESQSVVVNSEELIAGLANRDTSISKAFHVVPAVLPVIQSRGHRQEASETQNFEPAHIHVELR